VTELITHSRQDCFKSCPRRHWYTYERGLRPTTDAKALRMGSAFHIGTEELGRGRGLELACAAVRLHYDRAWRGFGPADHDMLFEQETVLRLICAYQWRWEGQSLANIAVELPFEIPLKNPESGRSASGWKLAGKIDGIVCLEDERMAVKETKLLGDDISAESDLWRRLRIDHQISLYLIAARRLGYHCETVLYDVCRKPTIKPGDVPILDAAGGKIVLDRQGDRVRTERGVYRQTGDKEKGYTLQTRPMTATEWGEKLSADIAERPDFYFVRREVPRLDQDLDRYEVELWDIYQALRDAKKHDRWWRTVNKHTCPYCPYFNICSADVDISGAAPEGFEFVYDKHPELTRENQNGHSNTTPETAPAGAASTDELAQGDGGW
jgi:hypothetical protein